MGRRAAGPGAPIAATLPTDPKNMKECHM